ncbi:hypothetical protein SCB71_03090 [Herbiconiux sp. KACC 21604]|uniref:hypothetical protein n=1 Tax=unclassified Herbiconiux TaxID=2618217 RepID=UPI0014915F12|nr:hypothetical protein [Herbiconiux sp. SALV-R1]QJU52189.1 hypothetical protein HL652_01060 [Herbiconiux sp. SALV-R1]WPO87241.1 hypothetical protein SCB71_03090 [Herbiconiux sp. KACC 21604]
MPSQLPETAPPQSRYQVRLHHGVAPQALAELAAQADHVIVVDALDDGEFSSHPGAARMLDSHPVVGFRSRTAAARRVLEAQADRGDRVFVDLVTPARPDGRFAVEDLLAAGSVVDALAELGIDYSSPEAAAACAAFVSLRRAVAHLVSASEAGSAWVSAGRAGELTELCRIDADEA